MSNFQKVQVFLFGMLASAGAMADVATEYTAAVAEIKTDIAGYAGPLIGVAIVGVGFGIGVKYVKKLRGAA